MLLLKIIFFVRVVGVCSFIWFCGCCCDRVL